MDDKLTTWINDELKKRGWSHRELGRRAGVTGSAVSAVVSGVRNPGWDFCAAIAGPLGKSPIEVFRLAGLLQEELQGENEPSLLHLYRSLSNTQQQAALAMLRGLAGHLTPTPTPAPAADSEEAHRLLNQLDPIRLQTATTFIRWLIDQPASTSVPTDEQKAINWSQVLERLATIPESEREAWLSNQIRTYENDKRVAPEESDSLENDNPHQQPAPGEPT